MELRRHTMLETDAGWETVCQALRRIGMTDGFQSRTIMINECRGPMRSRVETKPTNSQHQRLGESAIRAVRMPSTLPTHEPNSLCLATITANAVVVAAANTTAHKKMP